MQNEARAILWELLPETRGKLLQLELELIEEGAPFPEVDTYAYISGGFFGRSSNRRSMMVTTGQSVEWRSTTLRYAGPLFRAVLFDLSRDRQWL